MAYNPAKFVKTGKKIIGAGLNYRSILAQRKLPIPEKPIFFLKGTSSYITEGKSIKIERTWNVFQEVELGVVIGKKGQCIPRENAQEFIAGYCVALDLTEVSLIDEARRTGGPWTLAKSFDTACPVSSFVPVKEIPDPTNLCLWCKVNDDLRQHENTRDMVFDIPTLMEHVSQWMTLEPGDLLLTGSPAGPAAIRPGDFITFGLRSPERTSIINAQFSVHVR